MPYDLAADLAETQAELAAKQLEVVGLSDAYSENPTPETLHALNVGRGQVNELTAAVESLEIHLNERG